MREGETQESQWQSYLKLEEMGRDLVKKGSEQRGGVSYLPPGKSGRHLALLSRVNSATVASSGTLEQGGTEPASGNWVPRAGRWRQSNSSSCASRFTVNFTVGQGPGADIALHFNPRFDGWDKVVFNTQQGGKWGSEERLYLECLSRGL